MRFRGPAGTFPRFSAVDVLRDRVPAERAPGPDRVRGRVRPRARRHGRHAARHVPARRRGPRDRGRQSPPGGLRPPPAGRDRRRARRSSSSPRVGVALARPRPRVAVDPARSRSAAGSCSGSARDGSSAARGWYVSPLFPTLALVGALGVAALHRLVAERARADQSNRQLRTAREMVLHALTSLTETRDFETGAHLVRTQPLRAGRSARRWPRTRSSGASSRRRRST